MLLIEAESPWGETLTAANHSDHSDHRNGGRETIPGKTNSTLFVKVGEYLEEMVDKRDPLAYDIIGAVIEIPRGTIVFLE